MKISIRLKVSATWKISFSSCFQRSCIMDSCLLMVSVVPRWMWWWHWRGRMKSPGLSSLRSFPRSVMTQADSCRQGRRSCTCSPVWEVWFIYTAVVWFALAFHWSWIIRWEIALCMRPYRKDLFLHCNIVRVIVKERASGLLCTIKYIRSKSDKIEDPNTWKIQKNAYLLWQRQYDANFQGNPFGVFGSYFRMLAVILFSDYYCFSNKINIKSSYKSLYLQMELVLHVCVVGFTVFEICNIEDSTSQLVQPFLSDFPSLGQLHVK